MTFSSCDTIFGKEIRPGILDLIKTEHPNFLPDSVLSIEELNHYRRLYLSKLIEQEQGELAVIDQDVLKAMRENSILSEIIKPETEPQLTLGQRLADKIAEFGGSWTFIIFFFSFIVIWMGINIFVLSKKPFDPYPFILLNLILSCLAAIQAPIIMMSQNRQEQKDRTRAEQDYKVNLKAELEIKLLNEKIDHLLLNQNKKLLEIQNLQIDYLEDLMKRMKENSETQFGRQEP
jgi:uncharacterized membrane protein